MPNEYVPEALNQAKYFAKRAEVREAETNANLAIAWALIAICERLDEVVDHDSQSLRVSAWELPV